MRLKRAREGYTLLEMAIVMVIVGLVMGMGAATVGIGSSAFESAKRGQTNAKLNVLEDALMAYRTVYNRLPCPGDPSLATSNANYGVEAANMGACTGGTPAAPFQDTTNYVVEGAVPFKQLRLPEDFMYDGWGRKFAYAVNYKLTAANVMANQSLNDSYKISVTDATDAAGARTTGAAYVLASFGTDGHGGYIKSGNRLNAGVTNTDELTNCHCNSSAVATTYAASYVEKDLSLDGSDAVHPFSDYVRFKPRWQMMTYDDMYASGGTSVCGNSTYLALANDNSPYMTIYKRSGDTFTALANPATLPAGQGQIPAFSADGTYLAMAHVSSPRVTIYKRSGDTFTKLADPATLPTGDGYAPAFSADGTYLAVGHATSPYVTIYKITAGDTFTKLANPATLPPSTGYDVAFSANGTYLAVAHLTSPYVTIYKITAGDTFTKLANPATLPAGMGYSVAFSSNNTYLAVGHATSPYVTIYKITAGDTFTKLANPATLPASSPYGAAFSPDGTYLALAVNSSPYVVIYKITAGDTFTKLANPATLPVDIGYGVAFSADNTYLAVASNSSPYVLNYKITESTDTFTALPNPATLPGSAAGGVAFSLQ